MNDNYTIEIWNLLKDYIDKKQLELAAEKFVDLLADFGVHDESMKDMLGHDKYLDSAIQYYLELDHIEDEYDEED